MNERIEHRVLDQWFYPIVFGENGPLIVAPPDAAEQYTTLKRTWQKDYVRVNNETPVVCMLPTEKNGERVYVVRTELKTILKP